MSIDNKIQSAEKRLLAAFESMADGIVITDIEEIISEVNIQTVKMLGYKSRRQLIGKEFFSLIIPPERKRAQKDMQQCLKKGPVNNEEYHLLRADKSTFPAEISTGFIKDAEGNPAGFVFVIRDITHRLQVEEGLREPEERYRLIVETAEEGIWIGDPHGRTLFVNQKMADMLGYTRDEMTGRIGLEFVEVGRKDRPPSGEQNLTGITSIHREYKFHCKDGGVIWTLVNASPLFDSKGKYIGNLMMHTDITERKLLEDALARSKDELERKVDERTAELSSVNKQLEYSQRQLNALFNYMAEGVVLLDIDGRLAKVNPAAAEILGVIPDEVEGKYYDEFIWQNKIILSNGRQLTRNELTLEKILNGQRNTVRTEEARLVMPGGSMRWLKINAAPLIDSENNIGGIIINFSDVTGEKILREEKEQFTKRLLAAQEEERKRISRELHDDTAQCLALLTLEMDALLQKEKQLPEEIVRHLQRLRQMAGNTLQEVRRFSHELRPSVLEDFGLAAALELIVSEFNAGTIEASFTVTGDEQRLPDETELVLFRIAQEALSNVRKHSRASTAAIKLAYTSRKVQLTVRDNGLGFDTAKKRAPSAKGGLGAIGMRERAQLVGATLKIESEIGKGTAVIVEVPV